jgi:aspartyl-tRNA(Asn)/glutamyl-tRNA(Gln) amidotransferase subunit A
VNLAIGELRRGFAGGVDPAALAAGLIERADKANLRAHAYITLTPDAAAAAAARLPRSRERGPLWGVPYAAKDLFETRGIRTTAGSRVLADWIPTRDAAVVRRLAAAGAILLGKANMHEFAHGATGVNPHYGTPPNPWNPDCLAGGSSSGSAVAVALGLAAFALGSDTGGSIRVPAALSGIVGLKPTAGRVSTEGMVPYCWSLDHVGILTRSVADAGLVLRAIAEPDLALPAIPDAVPPAPSPAALRIGVPRDALLDGVAPAIVAAFEAATGFLRAGGARIQPIDLPDLDEARTVSLLVQMPEALSYHRRYLSTKAELYGDDVRSGLAFGQFLLAEQHVGAKRMIERYRRQLEAALESVDALITPTCAIAAPRIGAITVSIEGREHAVGNALTRFTGIFNMTGNPAISIPAGRDKSGLPIGLQLVGRVYDDAGLLAVAALLEREFGSLDATARYKRFLGGCSARAPVISARGPRDGASRSPRPRPTARRRRSRSCRRR